MCAYRDFLHATVLANKHLLIKLIFINIFAAKIILLCNRLFFKMTLPFLCWVKHYRLWLIKLLDVGAVFSSVNLRKKFEAVEDGINQFLKRACMSDDKLLGRLNFFKFYAMIFN